ncbi:unnamed protein product [Clonostachys chloroleuca]|uniref:Uncharacterized protein n=1 Tax=Clonostachys chloroleuca TaxID=1926264 RepID=A0AA35LRF1_9HYPO|nr:unnamed protein product [Clonostachys chloroleuca]
MVLIAFIMISKNKMEKGLETEQKRLFVKDPLDSSPAELPDDGGKAVLGNKPEDSGGVACSCNDIEEIKSHSVE